MNKADKIKKIKTDKIRTDKEVASGVLSIVDPNILKSAHLRFSYGGTHFKVSSMVESRIDITLRKDLISPEMMIEVISQFILSHKDYKKAMVTYKLKDFIDGVV